MCSCSAWQRSADAAAGHVRLSAGVTRAILLEEIHLPGLTIREQILAPRIGRADGVFITSTTRDLLPVVSVDNRPLKQAPETLNRLLAAFQGYRSRTFRNIPARKEMLPYERRRRAKLP
jgi:hypothetical protein